MSDGFDRAQAQYEAMTPYEGDICPKCGDYLNNDRACQDEECDFKETER